jgi:tetratricopeptide (TPR) repeat protein
MATYDDITIEKIDFDWIKQCDKVSYLRKAVKVIEADGDYYTELKQACQQRMEEIDPRLKKKTFDNNISPTDKMELLKDLDEW